MKLALEMLLSGPGQRMLEVIGKPGQTDLRLAVAAGDPDWGAIFDGYSATVDFPASDYWEALAARYPNAKVVLSLRDPQHWFKSTQETVFSPRLQSFQEGSKWAECPGQPLTITWVAISMTEPP